MEPMNTITRIWFATGRNDGAEGIERGWACSWRKVDADGERVDYAANLDVKYGPNVGQFQKARIERLAAELAGMVG